MDPSNVSNCVARVDSSWSLIWLTGSKSCRNYACISNPPDRAIHYFFFQTNTILRYIKRSMLLMDVMDVKCVTGGSYVIVNGCHLYFFRHDSPCFHQCKFSANHLICNRDIIRYYNENDRVIILYRTLSAYTTTVRLDFSFGK